MKKKTNWLPGTLLITASAFVLSSIVFVSVYTNVKDIADVVMICLVFVVLPLSAILVLHLLAVFRQQIKLIIRLIHWNRSVKLLMILTCISLGICVYSYVAGFRMQVALSKTRDIRMCIGRGNICRSFY